MKHIAKMVFGVFDAYAAGLEMPKPSVYLFRAGAATAIIAKNSILLLLELTLSPSLSLCVWASAGARVVCESVVYLCALFVCFVRTWPCNVDAITYFIFVSYYFAIAVDDCVAESPAAGANVPSSVFFLASKKFAIQ